MTKRSIIILLVVCSSITVFSVQSLSQSRSYAQSETLSAIERLRNMTEEERRREAAKMRAQRKLERERRQKELEMKRAERKQPKFDREQWRKEARKRTAKSRKEFLSEKNALGATEEQWKVVKPKLEEVQRLRIQSCSSVGISLTSSSSSGSGRSKSPSAPTWQWKEPAWKDKSAEELTEAQKIANELIDLLGKKNTTAEEFKQKMDALRKSRSKQKELKKQLSEAREELREGLTTRQEASLILKRWL